MPGNDKLALLKRCFGYPSFREGQEELIDAILSGRDAFGIMPTGGGKSICYQLPALMSKGVAIVISPLISLMKDQVMSLADAGIPAAFINSSLTQGQIRTVCGKLRAGAYKIVYVAPERLETPEFLSLAAELELSFVAVDEAHCISQWGQDFRPSYLRIVSFLESLPRRPVVAAFTATATARVREDIALILKLNHPFCITTGFDRPNLYFEVLHPKDKTEALLALVDERAGKSGIVYCATRSSVEKVCDALCGAGVSATRYHAGLSADERRENQEDFLYDRKPVMVATNAFGMGIDKSNVGFVIHYNMPKSPEAYYQEAGRAGRDGEKAECFLLFAPGDVQTARYFINQIGLSDDGAEEMDSDEREKVLRGEFERLDAMVRYCKTTECLRGRLLDYFGQPHMQACGNCGSCCGKFERTDITKPAQMILSCVWRIREKLGYSVGAALLGGTLRGSRQKRVLELGLDSLSTYGLMYDKSAARIREYCELLEEQGCLRTDPVYGAIELTKQADEVLFRHKTVEAVLRTPDKRPKRERLRSGSGEHAEAPGGLFEALRELRLDLAHRENVPAYIIFTNASLAEMAKRAPENMEEFLEIPGVGAVKAERYGEAFLELIRNFPAEEPQD